MACRKNAHKVTIAIASVNIQDSIKQLSRAVLQVTINRSTIDSR